MDAILVDLRQTVPTNCQPLLLPFISTHTPLNLFSNNNNNTTYQKIGTPFFFLLLLTKYSFILALLRKRLKSIVFGRVSNHHYEDVIYKSGGWALQNALSLRWFIDFRIDAVWIYRGRLIIRNEWFSWSFLESMSTEMLKTV